MACKKLMAEGIGTFWLVLMGCGAIALSSSVDGGIGILGVALTFGLALAVMAHVIGPVSGCHLNPAVTIGLVVGKRFETKDALGYVIAQVIGAVVAVWVIGQIVGEDSIGMLANGFDSHSPGSFDMHTVLLAEIVLAALFMFIVMGVGGNGMAVGIAFALAYILLIPIDGGAMNPARSTAPALLVQDWALDQLWLFWVAPIIGTAIGAFLHQQMSECNS